VSEVGNPGGIVDHAASWKREPDVIVWRCVAPDDNQPGRRRGGPAERWSTVGFGWRAHAMALRPGRGGRGGEVVLCTASEQHACGSCSDQGQPTADPPPTSSPSTGQVWVPRPHAGAPSVTHRTPPAASRFPPASACAIPRPAMANESPSPWNSTSTNHAFGLERAVAHDGGTAVEDARRGQCQGQVAGEVVEQPGPRRQDGWVDDEEVFVDQTG
jgi:hypothetical protein